MTNPERFRILRTAALSIIDQLEAQFDIERSEREADRDGDTARRAIVLAPRDGQCAPIAVSFTKFPGLYVRFGHWTHRAFPACGCDACGENPEDELHVFASIVNEVTAGRFREALHAPHTGPAQLEWQFGAIARGMTSLDADQTLKWLAPGARRSHDWRAWIRRTCRPQSLSPI